MNRFQKELFSNLPSDWGVELVPDVCFFQEGPGLLRKQFGNSQNGIPFINIRCIKEDGTIDRGTAQFVKKTEVESKYEHFLLEEGDYVLSTSGTLGRLAKVKKKDIPMLLNTSVIRFRATDSEKLDDAFLRHLLKSSLFYDQIAVESQGSAQVNVGPTHIQKCYFSLPLLKEQKKIAEILSSVDEVIELTEKEISKLQDLKKGMMQELLTKGIGHAKFKECAIGKIPEGWSIKLLDEVASRGSGHTPDKGKKNYWNGGVKWISLADSSRLDKVFISKTDKEISKEGIANSSAVLHAKGTVVMSRDAGVGKSAVMTESMAVSQHFIAWKCDESKYHNFYLYYLLQLWKPQFENIAIGSTIKTIGLDYFKKLKVPVPPVEEAKRIAKILLEIDSFITLKNEKRNTIKYLKNGLMEDLLTGQVRVCE